MKINGVFEVALKVKDLDVSAKFYQEVLGFKKGLCDEKHRWLFLWAGAAAGMSGRVIFAAGWAGMPIKAFAKIATLRIFKGKRTVKSHKFCLQLSY
ncbi:MAG: VOC family protein [Methylobacter sp.]|nr:VOC family protein [Methylobacter sp.]